MKQYLTFINIALCFSMFSFAQTPETVTIAQTKTDSIKQLLNNHKKADEVKVRLLNEYAREAFYEMNFMDGLKATHEAHELSKISTLKVAQSCITKHYPCLAAIVRWQTTTRNKQNGYHYSQKKIWRSTI